MVKYRPDDNTAEEEQCGQYGDLKSQKKKHSKDDISNNKNIKDNNSTKDVLNTEKSNEKHKKKHKLQEEKIKEECVQEETSKTKKKDKHLKENAESAKTEGEPKKKKRKHKEEKAEIAVVNDNPWEEVSAKEKATVSNVEPKENDSKKTSNVADGKKKRKPRHPGREERKKEKARMKKLVADGTIVPEAKPIKKRKRKRKAKKNEKAEETTVKTPRPKGEIPLEDTSTAEYKAKQFLKTWRKDKANWKFVKARQNWLVHHMYNPEKVDNKLFKSLLKYLTGMKGLSREITLKQAQSVLDAASGDTGVKVCKKVILKGEPGELQFSRAREIIQTL